MCREEGRVPRSLLGAALVLASVVALAQEPPPAQPAETPRAAQVRALVERLASPDFKQREAAREALAKIGDDAVPQLEAAAKDPDPERSQGAKDVLALLRWKLPPMVEAAIGKNLENYPSLSKEERALGLKKLEENLASGRVLAPFCANIARFDPDPELRTKGLDIYIALTPEGDAFRDGLILEALDKEPPRPGIHASRARLLVRLGRFEEGVHAAKKAIEVDKEGVAVQLVLADALLGGGQTQEALELLDDLAKKTPEDPEILARLGEAYLQAGEKAKGDEVFGRLMKRGSQDPVPTRVLVRVARSYMKAKRPDDARDVMAKAVAQAPWNPDVNLAMAELDLSLGRPAEALKRFLNEAKYFMKDPERLKRVREGLAQVFAQLGVPDLAQDDDLLQDAARGRRLSRARELAGRFLLGHGLVEEAVLQYRAAAALDPESVEVRVALGDGLRRLGRDDEAKKAYEQARGLSARDERVADRLKALALGTPVDGGRAPISQQASDVQAWDRRISQDELKREPEAAFANALPPLVVQGKAIVLAPGTTTVFALDLETGNVAWRASIERPAPPQGVGLDRVGLEPAGLLLAPAAACLRTSPRRARENVPLVALLANEWVRAPGRSFKKSSFEAALVAWIDPRDGKVVGTEKILEEPISSAAPPVARGSRALLLLQSGEERTRLVLLDLVAHKARWSQELAGGPAGRPSFAGDFVVAPYAGGVAILDGEGALKAQALEGHAPATDVLEHEGALWFGTGTAVRKAPLAGGDGSDVWSVPTGESLSGSVAVVGTRLFVSSRGGAVRAIALEGGRELAAQPLGGSDKAAARVLVPLGGKLFALNGTDDAFKDEQPALLALDPRDLSIAWRRPMDRPAALAVGEGVVVALSGGASSVTGLRVVCARPGAAAIDARPRFLQEMRAAATDALADDEVEVSVLITRRFIALKGGLSLVATDDLVFFARALARSRRPEDAEAILAIARARDTSSDAEAKLEALRKELGLVKEERPAPKEDKPADKPADEKKDDKPAGDEKK